MQIVPSTSSRMCLVLSPITRSLVLCGNSNTSITISFYWDTPSEEYWAEMGYIA